MIGRESERGISDPIYENQSPSRYWGDVEWHNFCPECGHDVGEKADAMAQKLLAIRKTGE